MHTKLTLRMEDELINRAKAVADYFEAVTKQGNIEGYLCPITITTIGYWIQKQKDPMRPRN